MPFLDDLVTKLETDAVGTFGVTIFTTSQATVPKKTVAVLHIRKTGGSGPEQTQNATLRPAFLRPGAQLVARADTYAAAEALATAAYYSLGQVRNEFISSGWYRRIRCTQEPFDLGVDDRGQQQSVFNVTAEYNRRD